MKPLKAYHFQTEILSTMTNITLMSQSSTNHIHLGDILHFQYQCKKDNRRLWESGALFKTYSRCGARFFGICKREYFSNLVIMGKCSFYKCEQVGTIQHVDMPR